MDEEKVFNKIIELHEDVKEVKSAMKELVTRDEFHRTIDPIAKSIQVLEQERLAAKYRLDKLEVKVGIR